MLNQIKIAIEAGAESQSYKGSQARYLLLDGKKKKLLEATGKVTPAGKAYYELLNIPPPKLFAYEQPLIDEKWVMGFNGQRVLVRTRGADGKWAITKAGMNYFLYNRDEYEVEAPYVVLKPKKLEARYPERADCLNVIAQEYLADDATKRAQWYMPISWERDQERQADPWLMTVRNFREARVRNRPLAATIEDKEAEVIRAATAVMQSRERIFNRYSGQEWREVSWLYSNALFVHDESRPFRVSARRTNVYDDKPPDTEVILNRPLASHAVPDGFFRPWELHEDVFREAPYGCVVQMLLACHARRLGPRARAAGRGYEPIFTPAQIEGFLDEAFADLYKEGEYPFQKGWREEGATSEMVLAYCRRFSLKCFIYHRGGRVRSHVPENANDTTPSVVYAIWGNHAYWFRKGSWAIKLASKDHDINRGTYDQYTTRKIVSPFALGQTPPFNQWGAQWEFEQAIQEDFKTLREEAHGKRKATETKKIFWSKDIEGTLNVLLHRQQETAGGEACFSIIKFYSKPFHISALLVKTKEVDITVRAVPEEAEYLDHAATLIQTIIPSFEYRGGSMASFTENLRIAIVRKRRTVGRETIATEQGFRCAICDDHLGAKFEIDHIQAISDGGTDDRSNLRALCLPCHAQVTRDQRLSATTDAFYSEFSLDVLEAIFNAMKPRQMVAGDGTNFCTEIDVTRCRRHVLEKFLDELPVATVLDSIRPYSPDSDLVYVDAGPPRVDSYEHWTGYHGPGWYATFQTFLMTHYEIESASGKIDESHFLLSFRGGTRVSQKGVAHMYQSLESILTKAFGVAFQLEGDVEQKVKGAILAMTGSWLTQHRYDYKVHSSSADDGGAPVRISTGDLRWEETEVLSNKTMALWGLIALNLEHAMLAMAIQRVKHIPRIKIRGILVDAVLVTGAKKEAIQERLTGTWLDETPIYKVKGKRQAHGNPMEPRALVMKRSSWGQPYDQEGLEPRAPGLGWSDGRWQFKRTWRVVKEEPGLGRGPDDTFQAEMAKLIVENGGAYVAGRGGTGKSHLIKLLVERFKAAGYPVDVIAFTHVQAANLDGGETIRHMLHAKARCKKHVIIVDETSMVSLRLWAALSQMQFTGSLFVCLGDVDGQLPPITDHWCEDYWRQIDKSDFMHGLTRGLRIELEKFRRRDGDRPGDYDHFEFVGSLYPGKVSFEEALARARERYPWLEGDFNGTTLVATNRQRLAVNEGVNRRLAPRDAIFVQATPNPKAASQPQDAYLWRGLILASATTDRRHLKNGLRYRIVSLEQDVSLERVNDEGEAKSEPFTMTREEVVRDLRLQHAITYDSSQARTITGSLRLDQTTHKHFSHRRLIVGLGRAPEGFQIQVR